MTFHLVDMGFTGMFWVHPYRYTVLQVDLVWIRLVDNCWSVNPLYLFLELECRLLRSRSCWETGCHCPHSRRTRTGCTSPSWCCNTTVCCSLNTAQSACPCHTMLQRQKTSYYIVLPLYAVVWTLPSLLVLATRCYNDKRLVIILYYHCML